MKKILIITDNYDYSSINVMRWLKYAYDSNHVFCIHPNDFIDYKIEINISHSNATTDLLNREMKSNEIGVVWTRKWSNDVADISSSTISDTRLKTIRSQLARELNALFEYYIFCINQNPAVFWLNHPQYVTPNKLIQLTIAKEIGLTIPTSWILNHYSPQIDAKNCITKPLSNCCDIRINNTIYTSYTSKLTGKESYDDLFISFVQENIPKEAEIRVFYLLGECCALLIHSQDNKKTQTDYRKYDYKHPNRLEPCQLPPDMESKIDAFMHAMNLQTGSLDFIHTPSGEYVFLEVNPCGQYDIFNSCNIYPDKLIAETLISKLKQ